MFVAMVLTAAGDDIHKVTITLSLPLRLLWRTLWQWEQTHALTYGNGNKLIPLPTVTATNSCPYLWQWQQTHSPTYGNGNKLIPLPMAMATKSFPYLWQCNKIIPLPMAMATKSFPYLWQWQQSHSPTYGNGNKLIALPMAMGTLCV